MISVASATSNMSSANANAITNVPKREASKAKRHFEKLNIENVIRWKCKYCVTNYGLNTSTSSLWKHLESKHFDKLNPKDTKQRSRKENQGQATKSSGDSISTEEENSSERQKDGADQRLCVNEGDAGVQDNEDQYDESAQIRKRKHSVSQVDINLCFPSGHHHLVAKRTEGDPSLFSGKDLRCATTSTRQQTAAHANIHDLVSDMATIGPGEFPNFQNALVQSIFFQMTPIFPLESIKVMQSSILSKQRERTIDMALHQCGWKFDLNVYPVSLRRKNYIMMDLVYRTKGQRHQACFLDCLEIPDQFPMELLSVMIFRKLCEFRVEDKLWQLFIGDSNLKGLAEILRHIFQDNYLSDHQLEHQTVDFYQGVFTVNPEDHEDCVGNLTETQRYVMRCLDMLKRDLEWVKSLAIGNSNGGNYSTDEISGTCANPADPSWGDPWQLETGIGQQAPSTCGEQIVPVNHHHHQNHYEERDNGHALVPQRSWAGGDEGTSDDDLRRGVGRVKELLVELQTKYTYFRGEMESLRNWSQNHLFLAYHMCTYCYYLCSELKAIRRIIVDVNASLWHLESRVQQLCRAEMQGAGDRFHRPVVHLLLIDLQLDRLVAEWTNTMRWWQARLLEYQDLRQKVLHFVSSGDNTSLFTNQFSQMAQAAPNTISEDKWMKYACWKIWKSFETAEV